MNELIKELATRSKMDRELWPDIAREPVWIRICSNDCQGMSQYNSVRSQRLRRTSMGI